MRPLHTAVIVLVLTSLTGCSQKPASVGEPPAKPEAVTFHRDVAPILNSNCSSCHRPGEAAPFSLLTYSDAKRRSSQIAEVNRRRFMPPWLPEQSHEVFIGARRLTDAQIETPYRPGGWTVRQVVHHVPDSHLNAFCRFKLALTENEPTIKPYDESAWAELADVKAVPIATSLTLLEAVHERWVAILRAMTPADFGRQLIHPETGRQSLDQVLALYAWHGPHHTAHITSLRERNGW